MSCNVQKEIERGLQEIGYGPKMISRGVSFLHEGGRSYSTDLVAYSSDLRKDADTAVIAVKETANVERVSFADTTPFRSLATPVLIFAEFKERDREREPYVRTTSICKTERDFEKNSRANIVPLSRFAEYLRRKQEAFSPRRLEVAKWNPQQLSMFDIYPNLLGGAFEIITKELVGKFQTAIKSLNAHRTVGKLDSTLEAAIKFLGARILRDREGYDWPLSSAREFFSHAKSLLPNYFSIPLRDEVLMDRFLQAFNANYDLSQVSLDMIGEIYETLMLDGERRQYGVHYTRSRLAQTILRRMPIEELRPDNRILLDPTCGSGSLLAAGYERLGDAEYSDQSLRERHQILVKRIFGNDYDPIAVMIAKMTLMLYHPPHSNNWKIFSHDVNGNNFERRVISAIGSRPTIVVANPPFGPTGGISTEGKNVKARLKGQRDRSGSILERCVDLLQDDGLMGIILTETLLNQQQERDIRKKVLESCQILEQWTVPADWFRKVNRSAMVWILRKRPPRGRYIHIFPLSDVPALGRASQSRDTLELDRSSKEHNFVPTSFSHVLKTMKFGGKTIRDFYRIQNGFRNPKNLCRKPSVGAYPFSGTAKDTNPYTDLRKVAGEWVRLTPLDEADPNFNDKNQRQELKKWVFANRPSVLLRANRNYHGSSHRIRWSSIALIDIPTRGENAVAPSENFHVAFPLNTCEPTTFCLALWALLNHALGSLYFNETKITQWISTRDFERFPLPHAWETEIFKVAELAERVLKNGRSLFRDDFTELEGIKELDALIYELYDLSQKGRKRIESNFIGKRPLTGIPLTSENMNCGDVLTYSTDERIRRTTFETLSILPNEQVVVMAIDGMDKYTAKYDHGLDGIRLKTISAFPGWVLQEGAMGWMELATGDCGKLIRQPEKYILGFNPFKNAYETRDSIQTELMKSDKQGKVDVD